jgi:hypothetical protein
MVVIVKVWVWKKQLLKKTMNVEKHVLNGDLKFAEVNGSSNKLKDDE